MINCHFLLLGEMGEKYLALDIDCTLLRLSCLDRHDGRVTLSLRVYALRLLSIKFERGVRKMGTQVRRVVFELTSGEGHFNRLVQVVQRLIIACSTTYFFGCLFQSI